MTDTHKTPDKSGHPTPRRGRPVEKPMPEPIPDTSENVARAIMQGPPKKVMGLPESGGQEANWLTIYLGKIVYNPQI